MAYGSVVNATANFRGQKNDEVNHALAALVTFPVMGVYAKSKKIINFNFKTFLGLCAHFIWIKNENFSYQIKIRVHLNYSVINILIYIDKILLINTF